MGHPEPASYAKKFSGKYEHKIVAPGGTRARVGRLTFRYNEKRCAGRQGVIRVNAFIAVAATALLSVTGCGGGSDNGPPPQVVTHILSDSQFDGDIEQTSAGYVVTQGMSPNVQSVFAGIDPTAQTEFRAFLDFPLTGPDGVPGDAFIDSAYLEVLVNNLIPTNGSVPIRVELVAFQPPTLVGTDFDRASQPPLAAVLVSGDITAADIGQYVPVDVTSLMVRAQQLGLANFQVRVMEDLGPPIYTLVEIDDSTASDRPQRAPLLTVTYH